MKKHIMILIPILLLNSCGKKIEAKLERKIWRTEVHLQKYELNHYEDQYSYPSGAFNVKSHEECDYEIDFETGMPEVECDTEYSYDLWEWEDKQKFTKFGSENDKVIFGKPTRKLEKDERMGEHETDYILKFYGGHKEIEYYAEKDEFYDLQIGKECLVKINVFKKVSILGCLD